MQTAADIIVNREYSDANTRQILYITGPRVANIYPFHRVAIIALKSNSSVNL